jgi:hypothetical protein
LVALEIGYWLGRWWQHRTSEKEIVSGDIALTAMYGLLGLVMAFTYSFTIGRADLRKHAVISEANALGTAFLRTDLIAEPERTELRILLRKYAETRLITAEEVSTLERLRETIKNTLDAQSKLWPVVTRIANKGDGGPIEALMIQSINDVIDMHSLRIAVSFDRLPLAVFWLLLFITGVALAVSGYNRGLAGDMNRMRMTALALVLTAVMTTITDFDRSLDGFVKISLQPLVDVIDDMDVNMDANKSVITHKEEGD